ncbi:hypothetical protein DU30_09235 [Methanosarcina mazei]|jgi:hypothetical protein|uniref:Uncharacterized protein n=1 Tax=Methanosarcina mazei TaxID=2209 RepID=A0A0F8G2D1_METMZ|nr:hypothetical protein DU30_09235 [Methanosarcina mazei]
MLFFAWNLGIPSLYTSWKRHGVIVFDFWYMMVPQKISALVFNDLTSFISKTYPRDLPNSLIIAQAFILKYPDYGNEFGLSEINRMIEDEIKRGIF